MEKIDGCKNNLENWSTTKISQCVPSRLSMFTISLFESIENKHNVHRSINCIKTFSESLRGHRTMIINFRKKIMKLLTKAQQESYSNGKIC